MERLLWIQTLKLNWFHPPSIHLCTWKPSGLVNRSYLNKDRKRLLQWKSSRSWRMNQEKSSFKRSLKEPTSHPRGVQLTSTTSLGNWGNKKWWFEPDQSVGITGRVSLKNTEKSGSLSLWTHLDWVGGNTHSNRQSNWRLRLGIPVVYPWNLGDRGG